METEYSTSMVSNRVRTTLCYGLIYASFMANATVKNGSFFGLQLGCSLLYLIVSIPLLGLIPFQVSFIRTMSWCLKQPRLVSLIGLVHVVLFVTSLLMYTKEHSITQSTTHLSLLWLMTIIGTSGLFDFWCFVLLFIGTTSALFFTLPAMDRTVLYFIQGLGSAAVLFATLQHELLVRKLFRQVKKESQFLARMSHEIRTPLNGVLGFLHELKLTELSTQQSKFVSSMNAAAESLREVTDDILDHLKQTAGKIVLSLRPESIQTIVSDCVAMFAGRAAQKALTLKWSITGAVPTFMMLDRVRINQMLGNLLSNAIKFTDHGSIEVLVSAAATEDNSVTMRVEVQDTGIGMSTEQQGRLFIPFNQADESITRRFGGTGIGLSLVKGFAELMGGTAGCSSCGTGAGSSFWFTVQTQETEAQREVLHCLHYLHRLQGLHCSLTLPAQPVIAFIRIHLLQPRSLQQPRPFLPYLPYSLNGVGLIPHPALLS